MGHGLNTGDLIALTASGDAARKLWNYLNGLRTDVIRALAVNTAEFYHQNPAIGDEAAEVNADATDLPTALVLVNSLRTKIVAHFPSVGPDGTHLVASVEVITAPVATDLATANTLANDLKADFVDHLNEAGVHIEDDTTNTIAASDATDQGSLETLLDEMKVDYNAHILNTMATPPISSKAT
jgi:hypothetical protein